MIKVVKFGGSSVAECQSEIEQILTEDEARKVVVVSGPKGKPKLTDLLIDFAGKNEGNYKKDDILARFAELAPGEDLGYIRDILEERLNSGLTGDAFRDSLASFGEEASGRMLAKKMGFTYVDPSELFVAEGNYGEAAFVEKEQSIVAARLGGMGRFVVPGFYARDSEGQIKTTARGGSDYTGSMLAALLKVSGLDIEYENWTDTQILAADPNIVSDAKPISVITFEEMSDMGLYGSEVFQAEAVEPVQEAKVPVHVRNTKLFENDGTRIVTYRMDNHDHPVVGIVYQRPLCGFVVNGRGVNKQTGILAKTLDVLASKDLSIEHVATAVNSFGVYMSQNPFTQKADLADAVCSEIEHRTGYEVLPTKNLGAIIVVGQDIPHHPWVTPAIANVLEGVNIETPFSSGLGARGHVYGVPTKQGHAAVNAIYDRFFRNGGQHK